VVAFDSCSIDSKLGMPPNPIPKEKFDNGKNYHATLQPKNSQDVTSHYNKTKFYMHDATHFILVIIMKNQVTKKRVIMLKCCHVTPHPINQSLYVTICFNI